ncbi:Phosphate propanoyltransferase [[Clostridium] ultunense Esp]|uniref:phosphate propanoyltransferase n=1 Tax=Thermicanus aegyptius TaxID=94009 RepID=UPI0002B6F8CA|nr:phosphate propanoyltransferase [Thermicanus aegyptius]CCQ92452.1 Phosphate propanoyltransferase [[Clostridium] ultunense Esp]
MGKKNVEGTYMELKIPVGVSNRHIHLSPEHLAYLFGEGFQLTVMKALSQPGQFAANETVIVRGPKGEQKMRILGPVRGASQVEISITDSFILGVPAVIRMSGDIEGTPGITVIGPKGELQLEKGVIVAKRHVHFSPQDAERFGVKDKEKIRLRTTGERSLIFDEVIARVSPSYALDFHVDIDEANAAGLKNGDVVELVRE